VKIDTAHYEVSQDDKGVITLVPIVDEKAEWPSIDDTYFYVDAWGDINLSIFTGGCLDEQRKAFGNMFKNELIAQKAAALMKRSNNIISACLEVDPDFVIPMTRNISVWTICWNGKWDSTCDRSPLYATAYVSTIEKADQVCAILTARGIK